MLKGSGYEENRPYKINVFDETGRPLMLISPDDMRLIKKHGKNIYQIGISGIPR